MFKKKIEVEELPKYSPITISARVLDRLYRYKKMKGFKNYDELLRDIMGLPPITEEEKEHHYTIPREEMESK